MVTNRPRRVPDEVAATPDEIVAAIEALTTADWAKLRRFADYRVWMLGPKAQCDSGEELLDIAVLVALDGTRHWNKVKVEFASFLVGAMRSISSNWAKSYKQEEVPILESDLQRENEEGRILSPLDDLQSQNPDPDQQLEHAQTLEQIEGLFKDDEQAQMVLMGLQDGLDPPGVRNLWNFSQKEYNAIVRRIRRHIDAAGLVHLFRQEEEKCPIRRPMKKSSPLS